MNLAVEDAKAMPYEDGTLDEIAAHEVFRQLAEGAGQAMIECYRVLKPGGTLVVGEGTPPLAHKLTPHFQPEITEWYTKIARLEGARLVLNEYDIVNLMADAGFRQIHIGIQHTKGVSIRQQLRESGLSKKTQRRIFRIYRQPPGKVVDQAYHLHKKQSDILIQTRHATVKGVKPGYDEFLPTIDLMNQHIPNLFGKPGKVLYIGARDRSLGLCELKAAGYETTVLEIWPPNIWRLTSNNCIDHLIQGDVLEVEGLDLPHDHYDVAFWWHGPEHIERKRVPKALRQLEKLADLVVLGCPNGKYELGARDGNPYEEHLSHWYAEDFKKLDYNAEPLNELIDTIGSELLAWRQHGAV